MAVDLTPTPVAPATVSYTPLDLSGVKGMLDAKVQQVETNAGAARDFLSRLEFKEGPFTRGNAEFLTKTYSDQIKGLINDLYTTGDTRTFGTNLAGVATSIKTDPLAEASLNDFNKYQDHLELASNPVYSTYDFMYTADKTSAGDIAVPSGHDPRKVTPDMVSTFYQIVPPAKVFQEYIQKYAGLAKNRYEQFLGQDENGFLVMRTIDETRELPIELQEEVKAIMSEPGASPYTLLARGLREISPEIYNTLKNDYEGQDTETMANYRQSLGLSADEAIGRVIENAMPYQNPSATSLERPTGGGGSGTSDEIPTVDVATRALATNLAGPPGASDLDMTNDVFEYLNLGDSQVGQFVELLGSENQEERQIGAYAVSVINNLNQVGDSAHSFMDAEFMENLRAAAKQEQLGIINERIQRMDRYEAIPEAPQEDWLTNNILNGGPEALRNLERLRNTFGLLGVNSLAEFTSGDIPERQALYNEALDQYDNLENSSNQGIVDQLTFGVGVLTKSEFKSLIQPYLQANSNAEIDSYSTMLRYDAEQRGYNIVEDLGGLPTKVRVRHTTNAWSGQSTVDGMLTAISNASNRISDGQGGFISRPETYGSRTDSELQQISRTNPTAFLELAKRDYTGRAQLFYTDVLVRPTALQRDVIEAAAISDGKSWSAVGDFFNRWDIKEYVVDEEPGQSGTGLRVDGAEIKPAYEELTSEDQKVQLDNFIKWANSEGEGDDSNYIFNGIIYPNGQQSETGLLFSKVKADGTVDKRIVFQPKDAASLVTSEVYKSMSLAQKTLAGKRYAGVVAEGDAFQGRYVANLEEDLRDDADMYGVIADYQWTDTRAALNGTRNNTVSAKIANSTADNMYNDGNYSVVAAIDGSQEVYKIKRKDNTEVTWEDYFNSISQNLDESQYHIGTSDYEYLLFAMLKNQEMLTERGLNVSEDKMRELLLKNEMGTVQSFAEYFEADSLSDITKNLPIIFADARAAYRHFSGQTAHPNDRTPGGGNPTAGFFPK